jgi:hypothetical protein
VSYAERVAADRRVKAQLVEAASQLQQRVVELERRAGVPIRITISAPEDATFQVTLDITAAAVTARVHRGTQDAAKARLWPTYQPITPSAVTPGNEPHLRILHALDRCIPEMNAEFNIALRQHERRLVDTTNRLAADELAGQRVAGLLGAPTMPSHGPMLEAGEGLV